MGISIPISAAGPLRVRGFDLPEKGAEPREAPAPAAGRQEPVTVQKSFRFSESRRWAGDMAFGPTTQSKRDRHMAEDEVVLLSEGVTGEVAEEKGKRQESEPL